ncbi:MAG: exo-alpha-sialidase [SAR202 cluster bacterium]|nr:exo-alpha-sialidase [SAR202 cluster bacterium]
MSQFHMTRREEMLAAHFTKFFHDSSFVELEGGRILHVSKTSFCTSDDGGITWSKVYECKDRNGKPVGTSCTSLVKLSGNGIGLAGIVKPKDPQGADWMEQHWYMVFWRSDDGGKTWEPPVRMSRPGVDTFALQDTFLRTSSGRIILPVYLSIRHGHHPMDPPYPSTGKLAFNQFVSTGGHFYDTGFGACEALYSDDDGRTWKKNKDGALALHLDWNANISHVGEPSIAEVSPGKLVMMMRTKVGRLYQSWSMDNGETWTLPFPTSLAADTTPAQIRRIPSTGHLLIVWNQEGVEDIRRGFNRMRMSSAISRNGGGIWEFYQNILSVDDVVRIEPGPIGSVRPEEVYMGTPLQGVRIRESDYIKTAQFHGRWSYPSVFVMKDRVIVCHTYTHYEPHATKAELVKVGGANNEYNQMMKVLPLTWFYGGKQPSENLSLPRATDPAVP